MNCELHNNCTNCTIKCNWLKEKSNKTATHGIFHSGTGFDWISGNFEFIHYGKEE